jgi:hypothetical protein
MRCHYVAWGNYKFEKFASQLCAFACTTHMYQKKFHRRLVPGEVGRGGLHNPRSPAVLSSHKILFLHHHHKLLLYTKHAIQCFNTVFCDLFPNQTHSDFLKRLCVLSSQSSLPRSVCSLVTNFQFSYLCTYCMSILRHTPLTDWHNGINPSSCSSYHFSMDYHTNVRIIRITSQVWLDLHWLLLLTRNPSCSVTHQCLHTDHLWKASVN